MTTPRFTPRQLWLENERNGVPTSGPCPAEPSKRNNEESRAQQAVIKWWQLACRKFDVPEILLMSIPNGGGRSGPIVGAIMQREGLRKGAPDLFLATPKHIWPVAHYDNSLAAPREQRWCPGLFIEMKTSTGRVSPEQEVMLDHLRQRGYKCEVCRSAEEAIKVITEYLT